MLKSFQFVSSGGGVTQIVAGTNINVSPANGVGVVTVSSSVPGSLTYVGTWNASTNVPTLTSSVGTLNNYYVVSTGGTTNLNGINLWSPGDWAIFNGSVWEKLDGSSNEAFNSITITGLTGYLYANNTSPVTASLTIPSSNISGLGTMSTQNANSVAITGGNVTISSGNVSTSNVNAGYSIVNINTLNAAVNGLNAQIPVQYSTTADLGTVTYNNGTSGVGATLTNGGTQAALVIDGHTFTATDVTNLVRILVKDETNQAYNGIYTVTNQGSASTNWVLTRATDYDQSAEINAGDGFYVELGSANKNTTWVQQTAAPITVGTTSITFIQFGASGATGLPKQPYTANTALYANSATTLTLGLLPITAGGTGAANATAALANLGGVSTGKAIAMSIVFGGG